MSVRECYGRLGRVEETETSNLQGFHVQFTVYAWDGPAELAFWKSTKLENRRPSRGQVSPPPK